MYRKLMIWLSATPLILSLILSCGAMESKKRSGQLEENLEDYAVSLRWGDYEGAARFIGMRTGSPEPLDIEFLKTIRVTSYDIKDRVLSPEQNQADVTVAIGFYQTDSGVVRELQERQTWWYNKAQERWCLDGNLPRFQ
jgi:hypothetical protein